MILKKSSQIILQGFLHPCRPSDLFEVSILTVSFERLSFKGRLKALSLGFSPAISLPLISYHLSNGEFDKNIKDNEIACWLLLSFHFPTQSYIRKSCQGDVFLIN